MQYICFKFSSSDNIAYHKKMISIIIPLYNDFKHGYIQEYIPRYLNISKQIPLEIIIVDGASQDDTHQFLEKHKIHFLIKPNTTRLKRIQLGLESSKGKKILIHHPRSILDHKAFESLLTTKAKWGGFTHQFDYSNPLLKFTSFYSNIIRGKFKNIFYLDHCIFLDNELKNVILLLEDREIFEDTEISKTLRKEAKGLLLEPISKTSSVRFLKNGIVKQCLINQKMKFLYYIKGNHKQMNKTYEKGLNLNNDN